MHKIISFKYLVAVAAIAVIAFAFFTGKQVAILSGQVSELTDQVKELQVRSESLEGQLSKLEKKLEPRYQPLGDFNR